MTSATLETLKEALVTAARATPGLDLLLVFGSRARGEARPDSDWDFGFLGESEVDYGALVGRLVEAVGTDRVDVVDLNRAGGLVRFRAARDGQPIYSVREGLHEQFRLEAVRFWCDAEPLLRRGYAAVLAEIGK